MSHNSSIAVIDAIQHAMYEFSTSIAISVTIVTVILFITFAFFCFIYPSPQPSSTLTTLSESSFRATNVEVVLHEAAINSFRKVMYSEAKLMNTKESIGSSCSICLADYKDSDDLRVLPHCSHVFHAQCVDSWLLKRPTCPLCRNTPTLEPEASPVEGWLARGETGYSHQGVEGWSRY